MAFHDSTCWDGVRKVVTDCVFNSQHFRRVRFVRSITYAQKVAQNTAFERLENKIKLRIFLAHSKLERLMWRLIHQYLDFPLGHALLSHLKALRN